jgi:hypothetical protein
MKSSRTLIVLMKYMLGDDFRALVHKWTSALSEEANSRLWEDLYDSEICGWAQYISSHINTAFACTTSRA